MVRMEKERKGGLKLTGLREIGPHTCWLRGELLRCFRFDTKFDGWGRSGLLCLQGRSCRVLRNRRHRRHRRRRGRIRHVAKAVHTSRLRLQTSGLRLQGRRESSIDAGLHGLLLRETSEARRLWCKTSLEPKLLLTWLLTLQLLLLLDPKLRLWLESCWLRLQGRLELLLAQLGQALSRRSNLRPRLRDSCQLRLQWCRTQRIRLLREVLRRRQRPLWRRRDQRTLAHS